MKHYVIRCEDGQFTLDRAKYDTIKELIQVYMHEGIAIDNQGQVRIRQPVPLQKWELTHAQVTIGAKLGQGAYGEVCRGKVGGRDVAIKQNHMGNLNKEQIKEVMAEARNMRRLVHPNIARLLGIAALDEPLLIVMELAADGSLDSYLKKHGAAMSDKKKAAMCQQVSWALCYMKDKKILHRDLAARNCLLHQGTIKLSDFGKSQPGPAYAMDPHERLPIRWLSPESMTSLIYDYAAEVWSFGVTCWEIFHDGAEPYPGMMVREVSEAVRSLFY